MKLAALLTSAGVNTAVCVVLFSLYLVLRKQPSFVNVYFGLKISQVRARQQDAFRFDRFVPSPSWILKSYANALISTFEDPEKILEQTVLEMNNDLTKMRQATTQDKYDIPDEAKTWAF